MVADEKWCFVALHDPHLWIAADVDPGLGREVQGGGPFSPIFFLWGWGAMEALFFSGVLSRS